MFNCKNLSNCPPFYSSNCSMFSSNLVNVSPSSGYVVIWHYFKFVFMWCLMMLRIYHLLWIICMSSFVKYVFRYFAVFKHWVACLIELEEFFIQFSVEVLWLGQMHTHSVQSEAYLSVVPEELLILIKFISSIFPFIICVSVF